MLIDIETWLPAFADRLNAAFPGRMRFIGLQGSYRRGEATEKSDIDIVAVLDEVHVDDLEIYREQVRAMPDGNRACGFLCGAAELRAWPKFDLLQLALDTRGCYGSLDGLLPAFTDADTDEAVRIGASGLYHMAVHSFLYEADPAAALPALGKAAYFLLRLKAYRESGRYYPSKAELRPCLDGRDASVLELCLAPAPADEAGVRTFYGLLMDWSSSLL